MLPHAVLRHDLVGNDVLCGVETIHVDMLSDKFVCFCKDRSEEKTWDVENAQDLIAREKTPARSSLTSPAAYEQPVTYAAPATRRPRSARRTTTPS